MIDIVDDILLSGYSYSLSSSIAACLSKLRMSSLLSLQIPSLSIIAVNSVSGLVNIVNLVNFV